MKYQLKQGKTQKNYLEQQLDCFTENIKTNRKMKSLRKRGRKLRRDSDVDMDCRCVC